MDKLWLIFFLLITNLSFAMQVKKVNDNDAVPALISSVDVNRIFIKGDRIKSMKGIKGAYTHENDEEHGEVYLQPTSLFQNHAFSVLLTTENGHHITLLLTPTSSPSQTVMVVLPENKKIAKKSDDLKNIWPKSYSEHLPYPAMQSAELKHHYIFGKKAG